jgi:type IV pilus assembly protein PilC
MAAVRRKVRSAMTYPIVIAGLAIMIVTAMLVFLVPTFERIFADLNGRLPLPTRIVMGASRFLTANALSVLALVVATALLLRLALRTTTGRYRWDTLKLKLPILGPILLRSSLARFSRSLGGLLRSGTMILDALQIASRTVPNAVLRRAVDTMGTEVRNGRGIAACMSEHSIFPAMVVQMVDVGEESGKLDAMLDKVAEYYEQRVQASVDAITSLIEPVLLVFMGVTVGGMVIALYLPMFEIINVVK